jgi:hypothetical protein
MLTAEKVKIFKKYKGYYDGYHIQNNGKEKIISDNEWILIDNLMQDLFLIRNGMVSESFKANIIKQIIENCDNEQAFNLIIELEKYLNNKNIR